jgi:hypothetical protein
MDSLEHAQVFQELAFETKHSFFVWHAAIRFSLSRAVILVGPQLD